MRKTIFIIMLCALQGACTHYDAGRRGAQPLLSFDDLGSHITVTRSPVEVPADEVDLEDVVAATP